MLNDAFLFRYFVVQLSNIFHKSQIFFRSWSDFSQIFGQKVVRSQSDFQNFWSDFQIVGIAEDELFKSIARFNSQPTSISQSASISNEIGL